MSIFRDISIPFGGRDYVVTPSVKLMRMIEAKGRRDDPSFNLAMSVYRMTVGDVSHGEIAFILSEMLNAHGAKVTADEVWQYLIGLGVPDLQETIAAIAECFLAPEPKGKKQEPPETPET
jgi:hypothetical protein